MPRRTQAQILRDETQLFLANSPSSQSTNERALRLQTRRNVRKLTRYLAGDTQEANLNLTTREQIQRFLDQMLPGLEQGRRFVLNNGSRYFTLTNDKFIDIQAWLTSLASFGDMSFYRADGDALEEKSDEEARDGDFYSDLTVTSVPERTSGAYSFAQGAFFPFTHDFDCDDLTTELENLGCWKEVVKDNYDDNCLYNAFKSAGVAESVLNAIKVCTLMRKVSRRSLKPLAEQHDLYIELSTDQDKDLLKYGNPTTGYPVRLALYKEHYIHLYRTKFNNYAVLNYDEVKAKGKNWFTWKSSTKRDGDRGMTSINLLRSILETTHAKPISISTEGIFKTQFYDQVSSKEFSSLEYPPKYSRLFHAERDGTGAFRGEDEETPFFDDGEEAIDDDTQDDCTENGGQLDNDPDAKLKQRILDFRQIIAQKDPAVLQRLDKKFKSLKFGLAEQAKLLTKSIPVTANVFFDFESSTQEALDPETSIRRCMAKITDMRGGDKILEKINVKIATGIHLDLKARARLYQEHCPHVGYMCCYSEFDEEEVHVTSGASCAKQFLDTLCERYGAEKSPDIDEKEFKPPVVRLLAHNITYDLSFIWPLLTRVETIEKGTSVVCGSALYYRFGADRIVEGGKWKPDKVVQFRFQDTYKMISMPLSTWGQAFGLDQAKEVMPYTIFTEQFINSGGLASESQIANIPDFSVEDHTQMLANLNAWGCVRHVSNIVDDILSTANRSTFTFKDLRSS